MKLTFIILLIVVCSSHLSAQQTFIAKGKIEFEKKENIYKTIDMLQEQWGDEGGSSWIESMKKNSPQFATTYFDLLFTEDKSLYKPGREVTGQQAPDWLQSPASENIIYTNLSNGLHTSQKDVYGSMFLLQDSARKVDWRITTETRDIAGFTCRKAVGRMLDSVYVVAFYTDQILATGGPESFQGLPGMILGVAIPRLNTTWFATKLELTPVTDVGLTSPIKGKKQTETEFIKTLQTLMKDWGKWGSRRSLQAII